jgi:dipeptidase
MRHRLLLSLVSAAALASADPLSACTNLLITRGASADGSTMVAYTADSHALYGELYHFPSGIHVPGRPIRVFDWDSGDYVGEIPQVARTYEVVGNMNERQVVIGETTYGGRNELVDPKGGIDYGSLIYVALQRSATAREAIKVMTDLVAEHGYRSSGESFSIGDPNEVWIMEMIGKGKDQKGAVWVAVRIPDGAISAHANHARIRQFPLNDPVNCLYSKDVISFAREKKYFAGKDEEFSFSEAYAPADYGALRFCESRVWSLFRRAAPSLGLSTALLDGDPTAQPLPLYVKPDRKLAVRDAMELMRDHFEGTKYDLSKGVGAGPFGVPYRWRPMTWEVDGKKYLHERAISTQQTGFSFVAQSRASLPDPIGGILWFGVDDTATTVWVPMYCGIRRVPKNYAVGTGSFTEFSWDSAFWVFNFVANWTYTRYSDMIQDVSLVQRELEGEFFARQPEVEKQAFALYQQSPEAARAFLTEYSCGQADRTVARWRTLGQTLFVKYLDGNVRDAHGKATHPNYPEAWRRRLAEEDEKNGGVLVMKKLPGEPEEQH